LGMICPHCKGSCKIDSFHGGESVLCDECDYTLYGPSAVKLHGMVELTTGYAIGAILMSDVIIFQEKGDKTHVSCSSGYHRVEGTGTVDDMIMLAIGFQKALTELR